MNDLIEQFNATTGKEHGEILEDCRQRYEAGLADLPQLIEDSYRALRQSLDLAN